MYSTILLFLVLEALNAQPRTLVRGEPGCGERQSKLGSLFPGNFSPRALRGQCYRCLELKKKNDVGLQNMRGSIYMHTPNCVSRCAVI